MMHALSRDPRALKKEIEYSKKRKVLPYKTGAERSARERRLFFGRKGGFLGFLAERSTRRNIIFLKQRRDFFGLKRRKVRRFFFWESKGIHTEKGYFARAERSRHERKLFLGRDPQTSKLIFKRRHAQNFLEW